MNFLTVESGTAKDGQFRKINPDFKCSRVRNRDTPLINCFNNPSRTSKFQLINFLDFWNVKHVKSSFVKYDPKCVSHVDNSLIIFYFQKTLVCYNFHSPCLFHPVYYVLEIIFVFTQSDWPNLWSCLLTKRSLCLEGCAHQAN